MSKAICELLRLGWSILKKAGIESYGIDARILLQHTLQCTVEYLVSHSDQIVDRGVENQFFTLIDQRAKYKPIAQIIGYKEFWKCKFLVNASTLIPRPETESVIENVLKAYTDRNKELYFADFGAGSGCIGLSLLDEYKKSKCVFVEKSKQAMDCLKQNAKNFSLSNRSIFQNISWNELKARKKFDFIVSNPPYISLSQRNSLMMDVVKFEPHIALFAKNQGLKCYQEILNISRKILKKDGLLFFEIDSNYKQIKIPKYYKIIEIVKDLIGLERVMILEYL